MQHRGLTLGEFVPRPMRRQVRSTISSVSIDTKDVQPAPKVSQLSATIATKSGTHLATKALPLAHSPTFISSYPTAVSYTLN
jgi:hypothetical protein